MPSQGERRPRGAGKARRAPAACLVLAASLSLVASAPRGAAGEAISPADAERRVGESVTVEAFVESVICSPRACLLSFGSGWSGLVATIAAEDLASFPPPRETYQSRRVRIRGVVVEREGRPRLEITERARIEVLPDAAAAAAPGESRSRVVSTRSGAETHTADPSDPDAPAPPAPAVPQTRVQVSGGLGSSEGSRVDEIVRELREEAGEVPGAGVGVGAAGGPGGGPAVSGLRDRVSKQSATIESLESEVAALQERLAEIESQPAPEVAPAPDGALPGVPRLLPYVVPARSSLKERRVRTGWSTERLVREIGAPREVEPLPGGGAVWYYEGGRAVTVGERGRVVSATGF